MTLLLAAVGVYGVLSYSVSQRARELSVRAALGAKRSSLLAMVVGDGLAVAAIGTMLGLGASALLTRLISAMLFGVSPLDPHRSSSLHCFYYRSSSLLPCASRDRGANRSRSSVAAIGFGRISGGAICPTPSAGR